MKISRLLRLPLCLISLLSLLTISAFAYEDCNNQTKHWYDDAVIYCLGNNVLSNHLQSNSTMQEPVTWLILSQSLSDVTTNYSEDCYLSGKSSFASVNWAKSFSIMDNSFSEDKSVSRLDIALALYSFFSKSNVAVIPPLSTSSFSDFSNIPNNYKNSVLFVETNSLMNGYSDGTFSGNNSLSICQLAQIFYNGRNLFSNVVMDKLFSLDEHQITHIELRNGNTGDKEIITEPDKVSTIVNLLNSFKIDKTQFHKSDGWSYWMKLYSSSGTETDFYISTDSITLNNVKYTSAVQHFSSIL